MVKAVTVLLIFQLIGETIVVGLALPIPGPVLGMAGLLAALLLRGSLPDWLDRTADGLLKHLSLLFVPASVGLLQHLGRLEAEWVPIVTALMISTVAAIAVGAGVFVLVAKLAGGAASGAERKDTRASR